MDKAGTVFGAVVVDSSKLRAIRMTSLERRAAKPATGSAGAGR